MIVSIHVVEIIVTARVPIVIIISVTVGVVIVPIIVVVVVVVVVVLVIITTAAIGVLVVVVVPMVWVMLVSIGRGTSTGISVTEITCISALTPVTVATDPRLTIVILIIDPEVVAVWRTLRGVVAGERVYRAGRGLATGTPGGKDTQAH